MFKRHIFAVCFLYSVLAVSSLQAMFSSRPPKVKAPKARPVTKAPTIPRTSTMPKAPTMSAPGMASSEMFEPSVAPFSMGEDISSFTEAPTISTTPTISTETIARVPRAPRSASASKGSSSLWDRFKMYWTQKRAYHTTVPTYQAKKSPGSSGEFEFNFSFKKLFKFQNPFSWTIWRGSRVGGKDEYEHFASQENQEAIGKWFEDYRRKKNLTGGQYSQNENIAKYILMNEKEGSEALEYVYNLLEINLRLSDTTAGYDALLNEFALIAQARNFKRFMKLFEHYGFRPTSQQDGKKEYSYNRSSSAGRAKVSDYEILGVKQGASRAEIHAKYLALANKYHPDRFMNKSEAERKQAEETMKNINAAYDRIGRK